MGRLSAIGPWARDALAAVAVALGYAAALYVLPQIGWIPMEGTVDRYVIAGAATVAVLLVRERFPIVTLLAATVIYPAAYGSGLVLELHLMPILLAAYTVAARGRMRTAWLLPLALLGVLRLLVPLQMLPDLLDASAVWWWNPSRISLVLGLTAAVVLLGRAARRQALAGAALTARNRELLRLRAVETQQAMTEERARIARELHDVVAHHISAVVIRAQAADRVADVRPEQPRLAVRWIAANGQDALAAMRQVVRVLRSDGTGTALAPQATLAEVPQIADRVRAAGLPVELQLPQALPPLPAAVELATVRIVQEALTNTLVHANATRARVDIAFTGGDLRVEVHDDGRAGPTVTTPHGGNGLVGMRERVLACRGGLDVGRSPLGGWQVTAVLPVEPLAAAG